MSITQTCPKCGAKLPDNAPAGICPICLMQAGLASEPPAPSNPGTFPTSVFADFDPPEPSELAQHFPQLEIKELLGMVGMGAVYKARQPGLDRMVAVKIVSPAVSNDPAFAQRFQREARALARLSHPNIVSIFDSGETNGQYYFIMEYVDGTNLRQLIESGGLRPDEALAIVPQICEALQFAHNEGIVHRDIKPENILVDRRGRVRIADFGLAKLMGKPPTEFLTLTGTHQAMGTLHYMAPEQIRGAATVDHRADIYSLGVVFYEMLTGQLPVGKFEPPSKRVQVDVRLDEVVLRALESEPEKRYQRAAELKHDTECVASSPVERAGDSVEVLSKSDGGDPFDRDAAASQLRKPMAAMFIVGLAQAISAGVLIAWLIITLARIHGTPAAPETNDSNTRTSGEMTSSQTVTVHPHAWRPYLGIVYAALVVNVIAFVTGWTALAAAIFGSRLEIGGFVRTGCGLLFLPSPVWPIAIPVALLGLSVLARPKVKIACEAVAEGCAEPAASILRHWTVATALSMAAALLALATSLLPWAWLSIFGLQMTITGLDIWAGIASCIAAGLTVILIAAFATLGASRAGPGVAAVVGGVVIAAIAGHFVWEAMHPPQTTTTVSGDGELTDLAESLAASFASAIQQRAAFGAYAALICGSLLAIVGASHLVWLRWSGSRSTAPPAFDGASKVLPTLES
jgi:serine/threonine protein kinase